MSEYSTTINYAGFNFAFTGTWLPMFPARVAMSADDSYPADGGYFSDFKIELDGRDIYELLGDGAVNEIVDIAVRQKLREGV